MPTQTLPPFSLDFLDLLSELSAAEARFLVVGGYAVAVHGRPRATKDIDIWVEPTAQNAPRVMKALRAFVVPLFDLAESELATPGVGLQIGVPPSRIDILTSPIRNKRAAAHPQDLADVAALTLGDDDDD